MVIITCLSLTWDGVFTWMWCVIPSNHNLFIQMKHEDLWNEALRPLTTTFICWKCLSIWAHAVYAIYCLCICLTSIVAVLWHRTRHPVKTINHFTVEFVWVLLGGVLLVHCLKNPWTCTKPGALTYFCKINFKTK